MTLLLDAGTSWSKIISVGEEINSLSDFFIEDTSYKTKTGNSYKSFKYIVPSSKLRKLNIKFDYATGHNIQKMLKSNANVENEIIALAYGALKNKKNLDGMVLDIGSRDTKVVKFLNGIYKDLDWNSSCGSSTGATLEMLLSFYTVNIEELEPTNDKYSITCGIFAMEKIMDDIASGLEPKIAISKFVHGLAYNAYKFSGNADKIHLSGGFCKNKCFVECLKKYTKVEKLGRFVLVNGLY